MAYKHRDIVIAWMDGETIQWCVDDKWRDVPPLNTEGFINYFSEQAIYRIKPKPVMIRHGIWEGTQAVMAYVKNFNSYEDIVTENVEKARNIIWLDEWHEAGFSAPDKE